MPFGFVSGLPAELPSERRQDVLSGATLDIEAGDNYRFLPGFRD
jgi:hypothetical protein